MDGQTGSVVASNTIRVCLVDDHKILCEGLAMMLEREPDIEVAAVCHTIADGLASISSKPIDIVVLDLRLENETGYQLLEPLRESGFSGRVIILAGEVEEQDIVRLATLGIAGVMLKTSPPELLVQCIRQVAAGTPWFEPRHVAAILKSMSGGRNSEDTAFSEREREVLRALLEGLTNKEIAERMQLRETAVKFILQTLFRKTGVHTRSQLVRIALEKYREQLALN